MAADCRKSHAAAARRFGSDSTNNLALRSRGVIEEERAGGGQAKWHLRADDAVDAVFPLLGKALFERIGRKSVGPLAPIV